MRLNKTLQMKLQADLDSLVLGGRGGEPHHTVNLPATIAYLKRSLQTLGKGDLSPSRKGLKTRARISRSAFNDQRSWEGPLRSEATEGVC